MTPPHDPAAADPDDLELVSASLDGELTAEETARVEGDPRLRELADHLRRVAPALAVDDPPAALVEDQVAAAIDHFAAVPDGAPVVDLSAERRRRWYHRVPLGAVAAALVVVALIGAVTQLDLDAGDSDDTATAADSADETMAAEGADGEGAETLDDTAGGAGTGGAGVPAPEAARNRAVFASTDALAAHIRDEVLVETTSRAGTSGDDAVESEEAAPDDADTQGYRAEGTCDAVAASGIGGAPVLAVVPAVVGGRNVTAVVVDDDAARRLVVVDDLDCVVVDDREL